MYQYQLTSFTSYLECSLIFTNFEIQRRVCQLLCFFFLLFFLSSFFQFYLPSSFLFFWGGVVVVVETVYNAGMCSKLQRYNITLLLFYVNLCCFSIRSDVFGQTDKCAVMGLVNTARKKSYTDQHSVLTIKASFSVNYWCRWEQLKVHRKTVKIVENSYVPHIRSPY